MRVAKEKKTGWYVAVNILKKAEIINTYQKSLRVFCAIQKYFRYHEINYWIQVYKKSNILIETLKITYGQIRSSKNIHNECTPWFETEGSHCFIILTIIKSRFNNLAILKHSIHHALLGIYCLFSFGIIYL